eukprot:SM000087S23334  [mRNA]  locus=s87:30638:31592:- [translate_table: standard]
MRTRPWSGLPAGGPLRAAAACRPRTVAALEAFPVITATTATVLALGRFVFLPIQRSWVSKHGLPTQNGVTHFDAGDERAAEVGSMLKTNDPAGFTVVDVLAWGAIGHAIAFFILATASNTYEPKF